MKYIVNARIIMPDGVIEDKALAYDDRIFGTVDIGEVCGEVTDAHGMFVSPGFVDVHIHGYNGADASDADADGLKTIAEGIAQHGVLSFLPTTMTIEKNALLHAFDNARKAKQESISWRGAEILGVHSEGPFINPAKKGAQNESAILAPDAQFIIDNSDIVRMVTVAPEMSGGLDFVRSVRSESDVVVSLGHTDTDFETALHAIELGADHFTHLFNAMSPLSHRSPGAVGAALSSSAFCELIADTLHVHTGLYPMLCRLKGDKLILITDCTRAGGMPDGEYELGEQRFTLRGIECRLDDGTIAGSVLTMDKAVRNILEHTDLPIHRAVAMASLCPALSIGAVNKGSLLPGNDADIILFDEQINIKRVIKKGHEIYSF